jgi:hypothetical protein
VKYGLIRDAKLFDWLEANMAKILARDPAAVAHAVEQSCINKVGTCTTRIYMPPWAPRGGGGGKVHIVDGCDARE